MWLELDEILCFKGFFYLCGNLRKCTAVHHQHNSIILVRIGGILIETCDSKRMVCPSGSVSGIAVPTVTSSQSRMFAVTSTSPSAGAVLHCIPGKI